MSKSYYYEIQIIRLIAAILVVVSHCGIANVGGGAWSVSFFIVLSGFLCAKNYKESDTGISLALHRAKKVYPFLFGTMFLDMMILIAGGRITGDIDDVIGCISSFFLLHSWFYGIVRLNSVAWFISTLLFCILIAPFLYRKLLVHMNEGGVLYMDYPLSLGGVFTRKCDVWK